MKQIFFASLFILGIKNLLAHPGIGIVIDSRENIYYTDLKQVWKITPDGKKLLCFPCAYA